MLSRIVPVGIQEVPDVSDVIPGEYVVVGSAHPLMNKSVNLDKPSSSCHGTTSDQRIVFCTTGLSNLREVSVQQVQSSEPSQRVVAVEPEPELIIVAEDHQVTQRIFSSP